MTDEISVKPLPASDWDASLLHIIEDMNGRPLNVHGLMANHPDLLKAWWSFRNYSINGGELGKRKGELVILRVAVQLKAWYEWGSHVERALACGLTLEEIERVKLGAEAPEWEANETALLKAVDELIANHGLSPQTHAELREHYSIRQVMDLIAIQGLYVILGCMINTWGLTLDAHVLEKLPEEMTREMFEAEFPR